MLSKTEGSATIAKPKLILFFIRPLANGILGFVLFFVIILGLKIINIALDPAGEIMLEMEDIMLAMIGFVLLFLISFLKNFQEPGR